MLHKVIKILNNHQIMKNQSLQEKLSLKTKKKKHISYKYNAALAEITSITKHSK